MVKHRIELVNLLKEKGLPMIAAELGVAEGYFSNDLLSQGLETLYMVDAWATLNTKGDGASPQEWHDKNMADALKRVSKHGEKAVILRGTTADMSHLVPDESLGLLYLDAGHSYESVKEDLNNWYSKVVPGGIIAGHDFLNTAYGVQEAVMEFAKTKVYLIAENKTEDAGFLFIK